MEVRKVIAFSIIALGILGILIELFSGFAIGGGFLVMYGLIAAVFGIILLISFTGGIIMLVGIILFIIFSVTVGPSTSRVLEDVMVWVLYGIIGIGIIYGIVEGIVNIVKRNKKAQTSERK